jgi:hypothetical protein
MKFVALKELPQGQQPGEVFDAPEAQGDVLVLVGAARKADDDAPVESPDDPKPRRRYTRRDLTAEA